MITGAHTVIYSADPEADRAFLRDVLGLPHVDAGGGWLIFGLPPSEVAVHPSDEDTRHELYLLCDDIDEFIADLESKGVSCDPVERPNWGEVTAVAMPGGAKLGVYSPSHPRPSQTAV